LAGVTLQYVTSNALKVKAQKCTVLTWK